MRFATKRDLKRHLRTHPGDSIANITQSCIYCLTQFSRRDNLQRHINNAHNRGIHNAIEEGDIDTVASCLTLDGEGLQQVLDEIDNFHLTPLHTAAKRGSAEIVELLLQRGARIERTTRASFPLPNGHYIAALSQFI
jgi:ankyrin repeat protein